MFVPLINRVIIYGELATVRMLKCFVHEYLEKKNNNRVQTMYESNFSTPECPIYNLVDTFIIFMAHTYRKVLLFLRAPRSVRYASKFCCCMSVWPTNRYHVHVWVFSFCYWRTRSLTDLVLNILSDVPWRLNLKLIWFGLVNNYIRH